MVHILQEQKMNSKVFLESINEGIKILNMRDSVNKNTFTEDFIIEMLDVLEKLNQDTKLKAVIIKGLSDIFCAGASKTELMKIFKGGVKVKDLVLSEKLLSIPVPVIAAMEGGAVGGGLVVGLCADIVIMAERSMYGGGFTDLGFTPGMGYTRLLQGLTGEYLANEMLYTGRSFKGRHFKERGIANYVLPKDEVLNKALETAKIIAEKPRVTLETLKYSVGLKKRQMLQEARVHEDFMHSITFANPDIKNIIEKQYFTGII